MSVKVNKGGIERLDIDHYKISAGDIVSYLQNQLGFKISVRFERCDGATTSPTHAYIIMKVAFNAKDIVFNKTSTDFIDRVMAANSAGMEYKSDVINVIKKYMYPANMVVNNDPENINRLASIGLYGDRLKEIAAFSKMHYCREQNAFGMYLDVEKIIIDMLSDPSTDSIDGEVKVSGTTGDNETLVWNIVVSREDRLFFDDGSGVSINAIFRS